MILRDISESWRYGHLLGIGVGGVFEPPTVGSFSHVQLFMPVFGALDYRPLALFVQIVTDQNAEVRVAFRDAALATLDGVTQSADRNQSTGQTRMVARSETNVAQVAIAIDLMRVWCPAGVYVRLPCFEWQSGAAGQGLICNPIVTGVGIAINGTWRETIELGPQ